MCIYRTDGLERKKERKNGREDDERAREREKGDKKRENNEEIKSKNIDIYMHNECLTHCLSSFISLKLKPEQFRIEYATNDKYMFGNAIQS